MREIDLDRALSPSIHPLAAYAPAWKRQGVHVSDPIHDGKP
jgi:hypothetical protein